MALSSQTVLTYLKHSNQCGCDLQSHFNKAHGLFIKCKQCNAYVSRINTKPLQVQQYLNFVSNVGLFQGNDNILLQHKFEDVLKLLNLIFQSDFSGKSNEKWFCKMYDHFYPEFFQLIQQEVDLKWILSTWDKSALEWDKFPNWNHRNINNYDELDEKCKTSIEDYVLSVNEVVKQSATPYDLHLVGFSVVLSIGCNSESGKQNTTRHYDELYNGNPLVITAKGEYTASPVHVSKKIKLKQGAAYFFPSWMWHDTKHGYRNDKGVVYKIMLKYLNKEIINGIFNNIGPKSDHEFLDIDMVNKTFKYKKYVTFGVDYVEDEDNDNEEQDNEEKQKEQEKQFKASIMNRNRKKRKRKRSGFTHKKKRNLKRKRGYDDEDDDEDDDYDELEPPQKKQRLNDNSNNKESDDNDD